MSVYIERMVGMGQMIRCEVCQKLIRWPEEARIYARTVRDKPDRFEHTEHPVREGATHA
jgi:hypothetical protein